MKKTTWLMLGLWIVLFLVFGPLKYLGSVTHQSPFGYGASDAFQHSERALWIKENGYEFEAPYMAGGHEDVVGFYPPLFYYGVIVLSWFMPIWDAAIWLPFIAVLISGILMFFIIKKYDEDLAALSVPFFFFVFNWHIFFAFSWGHWPALLGQMFFMILLTGMFYLTSDKWPDVLLFDVVIVGAFVGMILSHTPAAVFGGAVFGSWLVYNLFMKNYRVFMNGVSDILISVGLTINYLITFVLTWMRFQKPEIVASWGNPLFTFGDFGWFFGYFLFPLGILALIYYSYKKEKNVRVLWFVLLAALLGFGNYFFLSWRAFQFRFLWPFLLAPIMALPLLWCFKEFGKHMKKYISFLFVIFLIIFSLGIALTQQKGVILYEGLMSKELWQTFQVMRVLPENSTVYYFDSPSVLSQASILFVGKKVHWRLDPEYFMDYAEGRLNISNILYSRIGGDISTKFPHIDNETFKFYAETNPNGLIDVCDFDYFVFDKYSLIFAQRAIVKDNVVVFSTENYLILKNGGVKPCI